MLNELSVNVFPRAKHTESVPCRFLRLQLPPAPPLTCRKHFKASSGAKGRNKVRSPNERRCPAVDSRHLCPKDGNTEYRLKLRHTDGPGSVCSEHTSPPPCVSVVPPAPRREEGREKRVGRSSVMVALRSLPTACPRERTVRGHWAASPRARWSRCCCNRRTSWRPMPARGPVAPASRAR